MAKTKTAYTEADVNAFIDANAGSEARKNDCATLIKMFKEMSGDEPRMYGPSIVGFGNYHYVYDSGHEGDAPILAFSPRKAAITVYAFTELEKVQPLVAKLGKCKTSKACIYISKLADIDLKVLREICYLSATHVSKLYECSCKVKK